MLIPAVRSKWATRDAAARLAVRRHLPTSERAHFSQYKSAQTLYDAVVARYSSPATAALSRLMLPYLFPDLSAFPTVADLITHLRTSDTRYRAALPAEFCAKNPPPPMYIALYYVVARLPDSLRVVRDHFLAVCPTTLTVDLLEKALLAAEKSIVAVGASRGDPRTPIFEGCSPSPLLPSVASAAAADLLGLESVGAASAPSGRRRSSKGKGGQGRGWSWRGRWRVAAVAAEGVGVAAGLVAGVVVVVAAAAETVVVVPAVVVEAAAEVEAAEVEAVEAAAEEAVVVEEVDLVGVVPSSVAAVVVASARSGSSSSARGTSLRLSSFVSGTLGVRGVGVLVPAPTAGVAIFDLDFDAILTAMYVVDYSEENEGYRCFQPDPGIGTAALGACEAAALGASASALSGTGETALSGGCVGSGDLLLRPGQVLSLPPVLVASCLTRLSCGTTVLATPPCPVFGAWLPVSLSLVFPSLSLLSPPGQDLPVSPVSRVASGLLLTPPTSPPTEAPLQTLHMDVWGPAPVRGQGYERYFLLVVDDYSRYTTVLPLRSKGAVTEVLIDWIREARWQFYHPSSRRVLSSQDVTFDESVPFYRLFPYRTPSLPPPPDFLVPTPLTRSRLLVTLVLLRVLSLGVLTLGVLCAGVLSLGGATAGGAGPEGATAEGAEPGGAEPGGAVPGGAGSGGAGSGAAEPGGAELGAAEPGGAASGAAEPGCSPLLLRLAGSPSLHRSCASGSLAAGGVLLSLEVLLELELELLRPSRVRVLPVPELLDLRVLLELELLRAFPLFLRLPTLSRTLFALPSPTVTRLLATVVTDPSFESTAASALVAELVDFAARCRLDYAASLVAESASCLSSVRRDIPTPRSYAEAVEGPYSSQWQAAMDAEMASWKSTGTYVDAVPPPGANIVSGMWIFRVKRPPGSPPVFKARYVARGFRPEHMAAAKRVLRYLCSTSGMGLVLGGRSPVVLTGHADAFLADDQATQRSSQGYTFSLGSGSVSWRSTRSSSVLGSSCEAEIYAGAMAVTGASLAHLPAD
ncbi:unnamed protein product [Closterium sp. NIES-64]|nr:unnamed protein product [Closterium sp. NIES-64]